MLAEYDAAEEAALETAAARDATGDWLEEVPRLSICTNHTILIIDASGSMREADVASGGRLVPRIDALVSALQGGFILPQLRQLFEAGHGAAERELLSVILLGEEAMTVLEFAPLTAGENLPPIFPKGHGKYLPALTKLASLVSTLERCREQGRVFGFDVPERISTCVFFLSDGRPSDRMQQASDGTVKDTTERSAGIEGAVTELVMRAWRTSGEHAPTFKLATVGFGNEVWSHAPPRPPFCTGRGLFVYGGGAACIRPAHPRTHPRSHLCLVSCVGLFGAPRNGPGAPLRRGIFPRVVPRPGRALRHHGHLLYHRHHHPYDLRDRQRSGAADSAPRDES